MYLFLYGVWVGLIIQILGFRCACVSVSLPIHIESKRFRLHPSASCPVLSICSVVCAQVSGSGSVVSQSACYWHCCRVLKCQVPRSPSVLAAAVGPIIIIQTSPPGAQRECGAAILSTTPVTRRIVASHHFAAGRGAAVGRVSVVGPCAGRCVSKEAVR